MGNLAERLRAVNRNIVTELEWWHDRGYIRFHGVDPAWFDGPAYLVENTPGQPVRRLTELGAAEFIMGLFAGQGPRFRVSSHSTVSTSERGAA